MDSLNLVASLTVMLVLPIIHKIINGASDLLVKIFGDQGKHTRFAVGSNSLPMNISVEIDAIIKIR